MAKLYPYYYNSKSALYNTSYPNTTSAMYTAYQNWSMAVVFKNTTGKTISIGSVNLSIGMSHRKAKGVVTYSGLSELSASSVTPKPVSDAFEIPVKANTTLKPVTYKLNKPLVIKKDKLFVIGFKVTDDEDNNFLSVARTNALDKSDKARTLYNGQNLSTSLTQTDSIKLITASDVWHHQIPQITLNYENYIVNPTVSKTSLSITQGLSKSISVSGVDSWDFSLDSNSKKYISITKSGSDTLKITAKYNSETGNVSANITITSSTNGKVTVKVTCVPPKIKSVSVSKSVLRPTESAKITALYNDNKQGLVTFTGLPAGVSLLNNILSVSGITDEDVNTGFQSDDWRASADKTVNIFSVSSELTVQHPNRADNKDTYKGLSVSAKHWSVSDIDVAFSSNEIWYNDNKSSVIYFNDATLVNGKTTIIASKPLTLSGSSITATGIEPSSSNITIKLTNDAVVSKIYTVNIIQDIEFKLVYPITSAEYTGCWSYLPLYVVPDATGKYICNPFNYPIFITIPSDIVPTKGMSINYEFKDNSGKLVLAGETTAYKLFSRDCNPGETIAISLGGSPVILDAANSLGKMCYLNIRFSWTKSSSSNEQETKSYVINFKPRYDLNFFNLFESHYTKTQGTEIRFVPHGEAINQLYDDAKMLCINYSAFPGNCKIQNSNINSENHQFLIVPISEKSQTVYNNSVELSFTPIVEGSKLGSSESISIFERVAKYINVLSANINNNTNKRVSGIPQIIARGEYFMWDDTADTLANGSPNMFKHIIKGDVASKDNNDTSDNGDGIISIEDVNKVSVMAAATLIGDITDIIGGIIGGFLGGDDNNSSNSSTSKYIDDIYKYDLDGDGLVTLSDAAIVALALEYNMPRLDTASPWQYMYKFIKSLQLQQELNVMYRDEDGNYNVEYENSENSNNIKYRG